MNKLRDQFFKDCTIKINDIPVHILIPDFATYLNDHYDFHNIISEGIMYYNPINEEINSLEDIFDEWIKDKI